MAAMQMYVLQNGGKIICTASHLCCHAKLATLINAKIKSYQTIVQNQELWFVQIENQLSKLV